jgi:tetratricopeptide (TPR) repeat protein
LALWQCCAWRIEALDLLRQAIKRDPHYSPALSLAAVCLAEMAVAGWSENPDADQRSSVELARRALGSGGGDAVVLGRAAYALGCVGEDIGAAIALIDRSLELNPSFANGWVNSGWLRLWAGQPDLAIEHFETGLRLNPRVPWAGASLGIGVGHFFARRLDEAEAMILRSLQEIPASVPPYRFLASCYEDGAARPGERNRQAATIHDACRGTDCHALAQLGASRVLLVGTPPGGGRDHVTATRRLAAILAADLAGYSRLMGVDEGGTLQSLKVIRAELIDPTIAAHNGLSLP